MQFPRDKEGKLDLQLGTYRPKNTYLQVKYPEEVRLCLGVAQIEVGNNIVGIKARSFDYSGRVLVSINDYARLIKQEIQRVRGLKGKGAPWYENKRNKDDIWESEPVSKLKGC